MRAVARSRRKGFAFARAPMRHVFDYLDESARIQSLYSTGVSRLQGAHRLAKALDHLRDVIGDNGDETQDERQARLSREQDLGTLAKEEIGSGFRLLSAHGLVGVWGVMESAIDDWVVDWLRRRPQDLNLEPDAELKLPAVSFVSLSAQERAEILFTALRRRQGQSFGTGVARFERPLAIVGLSAPVPGYLSDAVFEMHKVRNVYAHCGGRADAQFLADCPWFGLDIGDAVPINSAILAGYTSLLTAYMVLLMYRAYARLGIRLVDDDSYYYWDPSLDVASASAEAEAIAKGALPVVIGAVPVIRARHQRLLDDIGIAATVESAEQALPAGGGYAEQ